MGKVIPFDWQARLANDRAESARSVIKIRMLEQAIRVEYQKSFSLVPKDMGGCHL